MRFVVLVVASVFGFFANENSAFGAPMQSIAERSCSMDFSHALFDVTGGKQSMRVCSTSKPAKAAKKEQSVEVGALQIVIDPDGDSPKVLLETPPYARYRVEKLGKDRLQLTQLIGSPISEVPSDWVRTTYCCGKDACLPEKTQCLLKVPKGHFAKATDEAREWIVKKKGGDYSGILGQLLVRAFEGDSQAGLFLDHRRSYFHGSDGAEGDAETIDYLWEQARLRRCPSMTP